MEQDNNSPWQYKPDDAGSSLNPNTDSHAVASEPKTNTAKEISWEASEFIDHQHGPGWYMILTIITIALTAALVLTKDYVAAVILIVLGVIVAIFAHRKPAIAKYEITQSGLQINGKVYKYQDYKSFTMFREGALSSINLFPLKRFMPPVSAYCEAADEAKIVGILGNYLPYEDRKIDAIERLSRRLRL